MQQRSHDGAERERRFEALLAQMQQLDPVSQAGALIDLLRAALELVDRDAEPVRWAGLKAKLGDTLMSSPAGDRTRKQEEAIACYNDALSVFERERFPEPWVWIQTGLGQLYTARAIGERSDNIEQAISHYEQALAVSENPTLP